MVTIFDTSSTHTNVDIVGLCMYTSKVWQEKEKYFAKQKKPALALMLTLTEKVCTKFTLELVF